MRRGCAALAVMVLLVGLAAPVAWAWRAYGPPAAGLPPWQAWPLSVRLALAGDALHRPTLAAGEEVVVRLPPGATAGEVVGLLWEAGVVPDPGVALTYLTYTGQTGRLQQGTFRLRGPLSPLQALQQLQDPTARLVTLQVLPGWRREEIAAMLDAGGPLSGAEFLAATQSPEGYRLPFSIPPEATLEGLLFPGTYTLGPEDDARDLVQAMLDELARNLASLYAQGFTQQGLTPYEGVILASIVQREAVHEDEMPLIASVFLNRLRRGMPLEADPTVQYALGRPGRWWPAPLSAADLAVDSPYNTYRRVGLPPTPIANPGMAALRAVAFPPQTPYLFFRAACDGSGRHVFSATYEEHLQAACP